MRGASRDPSRPPSVPMEISISSTDEEVVQFLERRKAEDPNPSNVIAEVNPFRTDPWNFPENIWWLYSSEGSRSADGEFEIRVTRSGYWKATNICWITSTRTTGRKTTLEFYNGKSPFGERTGWMMHEYEAKNDTLNISSIVKDRTYLCRVIQHSDAMTSQVEPNYCESAVNSDGDCLDQWLLKLLEQEENNMSLRVSANSSQTLAQKDQAQAALSSRQACENVPEDFAEKMYENYDFSKGEFLEINDLYSPDTSSASSDNSSRVSVNSDEYFDPDEVLRFIESDRGRIEDEQTVCKLNISATVKSNQVVISPPPQGSVHRNGELVIEESTSTRLLVMNGSTSLSENKKISEASKCQDCRTNQIVDTSYHHRTFKGNGSSKVSSKIAKIRKKYCCFGSF